MNYYFWNLLNAKQVHSQEMGNKTVPIQVVAGIYQSCSMMYNVHSLPSPDQTGKNNLATLVASTNIPATA